MSTSSKKQCTKQDKLTNSHNEPCEWYILFNDTSALRSIVEASAAVMKDSMKIKVINEDGCDGFVLHVDGHDQAKTCIVSARLLLSSSQVKSRRDTALELSVCCQDLLVSIDNPDLAHGVIELRYTESTAKIEVTMMDPAKPNSKEVLELDTFADDSQTPLGDSNLDFEIAMDLDISRLRKCITKVKKIKGEWMKVSVELNDDGRKKESKVVWSSKGQKSHYFRSDSNNAEYAADDDEINRCQILSEFDTQCSFEGTFALENLEKISKVMPNRRITTRVASQLPICFHYPLVPDEEEDCVSKITFFVGQMMDDA